MKEEKGALVPRSSCVGEGTPRLSASVPGSRHGNEADGEKERLFCCDVDTAHSVGCGRLFFHEKKWKR
jgi:hypothetical protein